jgi:hypothetical protein
MGVLSNSQTVGVNVAVRWSEANELQQGGDRYLDGHAVRAH